MRALIAMAPVPANILRRENELVRGLVRVRGGKLCPWEYPIITSKLGTAVVICIFGEACRYAVLQKLGVDNEQMQIRRAIVLPSHHLISHQRQAHVHLDGLTTSYYS